jgi:hypothetical protein
MGGGVCTPQAISFQEIAAWQRLSGNRLMPWEFIALREMDKAWRFAFNEKQNSKGTPQQRFQALGEYCRGDKVDQCRKSFGDQLEKICATCPD